jgi:hypothetical protein
MKDTSSDFEAAYKKVDLIPKRRLELYQVLPADAVKVIDGWELEFDGDLTDFLSSGDTVVLSRFGLREMDNVSDIYWQADTGRTRVRFYPAAGYVAGGITAGSPIGTCKAYVRNNLTWTSKTGLSVFTGYAAGATLGWKGVIIGGTSTSAVGHIRSYDPDTDSWTSEQSALLARYELAGFHIRGRMIAHGGLNDAGEIQALTEMFNIDLGITTVLNSPGGRCYHASFATGWKGYIVSGDIPGDEYTDHTFQYDYELATWTEVAPITLVSLEAKYQSGYSVGDPYGTEFYGFVVGGIHHLGSHMSHHRKYVPSTNDWSTVASYDGGATDHLGTFAQDQYGFGCGGKDSGGSDRSTCYLYNLQTDDWYAQNSMGFSAHGQATFTQREFDPSMIPMKIAKKIEASERLIALGDLTSELEGTTLNEAATGSFPVVLDNSDGYYMDLLQNTGTLLGKTFRGTVTSIQDATGTTVSVVDSSADFPSIVSGFLMEVTNGFKKGEFYKVMSGSAGNTLTVYGPVYDSVSGLTVGDTFRVSVEFPAYLNFKAGLQGADDFIESYCGIVKPYEINPTMERTVELVARGWNSLLDDTPAFLLAEALGKIENVPSLKVMRFESTGSIKDIGRKKFLYEYPKSAHASDVEVIGIGPNVTAGVKILQTYLGKTTGGGSQYRMRYDGGSWSNVSLGQASKILTAQDGTTIAISIPDSLPLNFVEDLIYIEDTGGKLTASEIGPAVVQFDSSKLTELSLAFSAVIWAHPGVSYDYYDYTGLAADSNTDTFDVPEDVIGDKEILYLGMPFPIRGLYANIHTFHYGSWTYQWEYSKGYDDWGILTVGLDETNEFIDKDGRILFDDIPGDWKPVQYEFTGTPGLDPETCPPPLYWIKLTGLTGGVSGGKFSRLVPLVPIHGNTGVLSLMVLRSIFDG